MTLYGLAAHISSLASFHFLTNSFCFSHSELHCGSCLWAFAYSVPSPLLTTVAQALQSITWLPPSANFSVCWFASGFHLRSARSGFGSVHTIYGKHFPQKPVLCGAHCGCSVHIWFHDWEPLQEHTRCDLHDLGVWCSKVFGQSRTFSDTGMHGYWLSSKETPPGDY